MQQLVHVHVQINVSLETNDLPIHLKMLMPLYTELLFDSAVVRNGGERMQLHVLLV